MDILHGLKRGVNLGGWLSQCDYSRERLADFITEIDFARIASWGLDHVRLPVDYNLFEKSGESECPVGFERVDFALSMCEKYRLNLVLDLHKTAGFSFDAGEGESGFFTSPALQERFYGLWEAFAARYGVFTDRVAFELLNEVTDPTFMESWNRIVHVCVRRIRAIAPDVRILVGGYHNSSVEGVAALDAPDDDKVIYNFHCYDPLHFTHQGAYWVPQLDREARYAFDDCDISAGMFMERFKPALDAAKKYHTALYCGEYGVIDRAAPEDTLKWYRAIHEAFEALGIARCAWSYREMDFGIADSRMDQVRDELIRNL